MIESEPPASTLTDRAARLLDPLSAFYAADGVPIPPCARIEPGAMPPPYRDLLVHERDMTSTLEDHHGARLELRLLQMKHDSSTLLRQVALVTADTQRVVEIGGIRIALHRFAEPVRKQIQASRVPLGAVLRQFDVPYSSRPSAYLSVEADDTLQRMIDLDGPCTLYGRRNVLSDPEGAALAEVLEILPPMERVHD